MAERIAQAVAQVTETAGITTLVVIWISASLKWLNENHLAVISIVAILTFIVTAIAARYRHVLRKREIYLYELEVKGKIRRKEDK